MSNVSRTLICHFLIIINFRKFKCASFIFSKIFHRLSKRLLQFLNCGVVDRIFPASSSDLRCHRSGGRNQAPGCVFASKKCIRRLFFSEGRPAFLLKIEKEAAANESEINKEAPSKNLVVNHPQKSVNWNTAAPPPVSEVPGRSPSTAPLQTWDALCCPPNANNRFLYSLRNALSDKFTVMFNTS